MSEYEGRSVDVSGVSLEAIDARVVVGATIAGVVIDLTALLVPLLTRIGGGVVAGFLAASAVRRLASGMGHAVIASGVVGAVAGAMTGFLGAVLGLYNEPPLLVLDSIGPVSPMLSGLGLPSVLLIAGTFSLLTAVDGVVGGAVGTVVRALLPW